MKQAPDQRRLEEILRSAKLSAGGFLGVDRRPADEIIETDLAALRKLGLDPARVAARLREITDLARSRPETPVPVDAVRRARLIEARGLLPCPWPHAGRYRKNLVVLSRTDGDERLMWSDLSVHLIEVHGFFQGRGSRFRIEPAALVHMIF